MQVRDPRRRPVRVRRLALSLLAVVALMLMVPGPPAGSGAKPAETVIVLPGASSAEGIAAGRGSTFYAGDFSRSDIFRGDVRRRTAELFIDAPEGRQALGMAVDRRHHLLFVAGGATGQAYVYDLDSEVTVATYQLAPPDSSIVNDVTVTSDGVDAVIASDRFQVPTTAARFGHRLAVVNSRFDTGVPPTATRFDVVVLAA